MTRHGETVLKEALALSEQERAEIVNALLESLGPEPEADIESAWRQEVAARVAALDAGEVETIPWESVLDRFQARLDEKRQG